MLRRKNSKELEPPGKGLPFIELLIARALIRRKLRRSTVEEARKAFATERSEILSLVKAFSEEEASTPILISRLKGLEDSSRHWSLYMTMEHLRIVNRSSIAIISDLLAENKPSTIVSTSSVKPAPGIDSSVIERFTEVCDEFENRFGALSSLKSKETLAHPWFGELNAEQWHFFAGFHMALHKKQMDAIAETLRTLSTQRVLI